MMTSILADQKLALTNLFVMPGEYPRLYKIVTVTPVPAVNGRGSLINLGSFMCLFLVQQLKAFSKKIIRTIKATIIVDIIFPVLLLLLILISR